MNHGAKILVVSDDEPARYVKVQLLRLNGCEVIEAASGLEALAALKADGVNLVLLDVRLPDVDGMDLCQRIKDSHPNVFVLQTSPTFVDSPDRVRALDKGADAFLMEPIEPPELLATVRSLLRLQKVESALRDSEARLQLAQESAGLAVLDCNLETKATVWSPGFPSLFDLPPDAPVTFDVLRSAFLRIHPDEQLAMQSRFRLLRTEGGSFEQDFRLTTRAGETRWIASRGTMLQGESGRPERLLCLSSDITKRKEAEGLNAQLASVVASSLDAIVSLDLNDTILTWNAGADRLFGYRPEEVIGQKVRFAVPPAKASERDDMMHRLKKGEAVEYETLRQHRDGHFVDVWIRGAPMRAGNGSLIGASLVIRDTTAQKRREEHVRFLLRELTHRSKNLLAVIQAMARQSLTHLASPEEFVTRFSERLSGLAGSHDLLSSDDFEGASLVQLIRSQLQHYLDLIDKRIILEGDDLFVGPEAAQNIGIALHELSTNAAKYGALAGNAGAVSIRWSLSAPVDSAAGEIQRFHMAWEELGGPAVVAPSRRGFGRVVMDRVTGQALGGTSLAEFAPEGVRWTLDVPASAVIYKR